MAKDQLGCAELGDGQRLWLEVLRTKRDGSVEALCEGEVVRLQEQAGALTLAHQGGVGGAGWANGAPACSCCSCCWGIAGWLEMP